MAKSSTVVFTLDPTDTLDYRTYYAPFRVPSEQPTVEFVLKIEGVRCTFYRSHRVVLQGKKATLVLAVFFTRYEKDATIVDQPSLVEDTIAAAAQPPTPTGDWPANVTHMVGSDEVGTGDYFGGAVVCAARITRDDLSFLKELGVDDSKKLSDQFIRKVAPILMERIEYRISFFWAEQYNNFYQHFQNANMIKAFLHVDALRRLQQPGDFTVVDEFVAAKIWDQYLEKLALEPVKISVMTPHAEGKYLVVACASVIARYYFLERMAEQDAQWGMKFALGGWNPKVRNSILTFLKTYPIEDLNRVVKLHFRNLEKILEKVW